MAHARAQRAALSTCARSRSLLQLAWRPACPFTSCEQFQGFARIFRADQQLWTRHWPVSTMKVCGCDSSSTRRGPGGSWICSKVTSEDRNRLQIPVRMSSDTSTRPCASTPPRAVLLLLLLLLLLLFATHRISQSCSRCRPTSTASGSMRHATRLPRCFL
jgi:hypothetical protein